jgi:hypothetical protein
MFFVTAQRREQHLQMTPLTIMALSADALAYGAQIQYGF